MLDAVNVKYEVSGSQSKTVRVYAYEIAAENQRLIETSVGEIDLDWNETSVRIDITDLKDAPLSKILNRIDSAAHIMNSLYPLIDGFEATHHESTNDVLRWDNEGWAGEYSISSSKYNSSNSFLLEGNDEGITSRGFEDVVASSENFTSVIIAGNEVTWDAIAVYGESVIEGIKKMDGRSSLWGRQQKHLMNETVGGITSKVSVIGTVYDMVAPAAVDTYENYVNDAEVSEFVADAGVDLAISTAVVVSSAKLGAQARAQYDGPKGMLAGAVAGAGVGLVSLWAIDTVEGVIETGETVRETLQYGAKMLYEWFVK